MASPEHYGHIDLLREATEFIHHGLEPRLGRVVLHGAQVIVGLTSDHGVLVERDPVLTDPAAPKTPLKRRSLSLRLPKDTIENLHTFYETFHANEPPETYFDCHTTAQVIAGHETEHVPIDVEKYVYTPFPAINGVLEPGTMYAMQTDPASPVRSPHTVIGVGLPARCLSTLGRRGPLVLGFTREVMRFFGATSLQRMDRHE